MSQFCKDSGKLCTSNEKKKGKNNKERVGETRHTWSTLFASWVQIIVQSLIAPTAWLFVVFLDGGYYRCLFAHDFCNLTTARQCQNETVMAFYLNNPAFDKISANRKVRKFCPACICNLDGQDASYLEAESQIYAWFILIIAGVSTFFAICCVRMCDKYTYVQHQYVETYKMEEISKFEQVAKVNLIR
ncbi:unnamed protein product [Strongylus vulgaris]|uniref:Uncharacterized protein n=1 Tax=Strongylus vulgaris TaxID=40348 RepID=A0A3P7IUT0_STRVU|nr:unnamed protein product [Strongylus vulgaris]